MPVFSPTTSFMSDIPILRKNDDTKRTNSRIVTTDRYFFPGTPSRLFSANNTANIYYNSNIHFSWDGASVMDRYKDSLLRIEEIENLPENWNENGADKFSKELIENAKQLVMSLSKQPFIFPTARDSIQFEYEKENGDYLEFELFSHKRLKMFSYTHDGKKIKKEIPFEEMNRVVSSFYGRDF